MYGRVCLRSFIIFIIFIINLYGFEVTKGTVGIFELEKNITPYKVLLDEKEIEILSKPTNDGHFIIIPIDYKTKKESEKLTIFLENEKKEFVINISEGEYKKERLSVEPSKVNPPKSAQTRIKKEFNEAMAIYNSKTPKREWSKPFLMPLETPVTSNFGNARIYNGELKSYHSGTDFRAPVGTPIKAVNDGVVVISKDRYYAGGSIVIDHGEGIYSCYYHLSKMDFKTGDRVKRGEIIGKSGASGRVTGPHLHFAFMVQGVQVDPLDFLNKINQLF